MVAVAQDGYALKFASPRLRADRHVVLCAVSQAANSPKVWLFASKELQVANKVLMAAAQGRESALDCWLSSCEDEAVVLVAVQRDASKMRYAAESLKRDKAFVMSAVRANPQALQYCSQKMREDKELKETALEMTVEAMRQAAGSTRTFQRSQQRPALPTARRRGSPGQKTAVIRLKDYFDGTPFNSLKAQRSSLRESLHLDESDSVSSFPMPDGVETL